MHNNFSNSTDNEINEFYKRTSQRVKFFRESKKITQLDLALEIGIKSVAFYSNCENNRYNKHFNLEHLYKIAKAFNIKICELIEGEV